MDSIEAGVITYAALGFRRRTAPVHVASQAVRVSFIELKAGTYVELVQPTAPTSPLKRFMTAGFYHLAFLVSDVEASAGSLRAAGFEPLPAFSSEAFGGGRCQFFVSPARELFELVEMSAEAFEALFEARAADVVAP